MGTRYRPDKPDTSNASTVSSSITETMCLLSVKHASTEFQRRQLGCFVSGWVVFKLVDTPTIQNVVC